MKLSGYNRERNISESITIEKTSEGWNIGGFGMKRRNCDRTGAPQLFIWCSEVNISCPPDFGSLMMQLWNEIERNNLSEDEIQSRLDELSGWLGVV
ncbi:MAG: hypothetical protein FP824_06515 [Euryarchaeota archaeon]|nr:hypothetical protein [Euryarchaeota archaeon]